MKNKTFQKFVQLVFFLGALMLPQYVFSVEIDIETPEGGFTTERIQKIKGRVTGYDKTFATLVLNGIPQGMVLHNGAFEVNVVAAPGNNMVEVIAGDTRKAVSFFAKVPGKDIKVVLTWDTPTDVDLWVIDPKGEKCYYAHRSTSSGGNLDVDITAGYGPETFTMAKALPGEYSVQVQYYSSSSIPVTRVDVYVLTGEGTPKEERQHFQFTMTKQHQVYHIANFKIEENN